MPFHDNAYVSQAPAGTLDKGSHLHVTNKLTFWSYPFDQEIETDAGVSSPICNRQAHSLLLKVMSYFLSNANLLERKEKLL